MNDKVTDKRPAFFMVEDAVVEKFDLTPYEGWVYITILKYANRKTGEAFPGIATLAKVTRMSKSQVMRSIATLEKKCLIKVVRDDKPIEGEKRKRDVNHYFVLSASSSVSQEVGVVSGRKYPSVSQEVGVVSGSDKNQNGSEPELINKNTRKRSTTRTKSTETEPIHPLIQAWATIRKIDATNIGAPIYSRNDLALAKRMAKWDVPPTCEEITFAIQSSKTPQKYHFRYLEADIPQHRLAKTPPPVATSETGETYFEHARRQGRAMFFGEDE